MRGWIGTAMALALAAPVPAKPADDAFLGLFDRDAKAERAERSGDGDPDAPRMGRLPDVKPAAQAARLARLEGSLKALDAIDAKTLSPQRQTDAAVYRYALTTQIAQLTFKQYEMPFNSDSNFWSGFANVGRSLRTEQDYRGLIDRLRSLPGWFEDQIANLKAGAARGFTPPKVTLAGRERSLDAIADAASPESSPLYAAFRTMPATIPAAAQTELRAQATAAIARDIPAYRKLRAYLHDDYIPHARTTLAAEALPDGKAFYRAQIDEYATVDLTPQQIHAIGLSEVARIHAEMLETIKQSGFKGDFPAFLQFLRTDPQFYAKTPDELLKEAAWIAKQVDGKVGLYIGRLPRKRFAIVPVAPDIAPFYTAGRGGDGVYLLNTYDLPSRPLYQLAALTLHESAPGHAMQIPLAAENKDRLPFRRRLYISAYGEGWALYCETLGAEMGLYPTPYEKFGMLSYQMWRAARLVIDTGVHAMGWSREQAQAYLHDNTGLSNHEIETEVDRYISWPGQALAYYLGEMAIRDGRRKAEAALGPKFNIRAYHDMVLAQGSVPLPVLKAAVDRFVAAGGKGPYPDEE